MTNYKRNLGRWSFYHTIVVNLALLLCLPSPDLLAQPSAKSIFAAKKASYDAVQQRNLRELDAKQGMLRKTEPRAPSYELRVNPQLPLSLASLQDLAAISIPPEDGQILEVWSPPDRGGRESNPTVILLQDLHTQPEAQQAEGRILQHLHKAYNLKLVASEGATGPFDLALFQQFPKDKVLRTLLAKTFLTAGEMTGHEYQAITEQLPIQIYGVEEPQLYAEHGEVFKQVLDIAPAAQQTVAQIQQALDTLKPTLYPKPLQAFLQLGEAFQHGDLALADYVRQLTELAKQQGLSWEAVAPNLARLQQIQQLEASVNRQHVEAELQRLLPALAAQLQQESSSPLRAEFDTLASQFQRQAVAAAYFYPRLLGIARQAKIDLTTYSALTVFTDDLKLAQAVQSHRIAPELEQLERSLTERLAGSENAKTLAKLSHHARLLHDLFSLKLTPDQVAYYQAHRDEFTAQTFLAFLEKQAPHHGLAGFSTRSARLNQNVRSSSSSEANEVSAVEKLPQDLTDVVDAHLPFVERFYTLAHQRDRVLCEKTLALLEGQGIAEPGQGTGDTGQEAGSVKRELQDLGTKDISRTTLRGGLHDVRRATNDARSQAVVLVAGGFHTPGITAQLRERQIPYVVITPTAAGELDEARYHRLVRGETTSLTQLVDLAWRQRPAMQTAQAASSMLPAVVTATAVQNVDHSRRKWVVAALLVGVLLLGFAVDAMAPEAQAALTPLDPPFTQALPQATDVLRHAATADPHPVVAQLETWLATIQPTATAVADSTHVADAAPVLAMAGIAQSVPRKRLTADEINQMTFEQTYDHVATLSALMQAQQYDAVDLDELKRLHQHVKDVFPYRRKISFEDLTYEEARNYVLRRELHRLAELAEIYELSRTVTAEDWKLFPDVQAARARADAQGKPLGVAGVCGGNRDRSPGFEDILSAVLMRLGRTDMAAWSAGVYEMLLQFVPGEEPEKAAMFARILRGLEGQGPSFHEKLKVPDDPEAMVAQVFGKPSRRITRKDLEQLELVFVFDKNYKTALVQWAHDQFGLQIGEKIKVFQDDLYIKLPKPVRAKIAREVRGAIGEKQFQLLRLEKEEVEGELVSHLSTKLDPMSGTLQFQTVLTFIDRVVKFGLAPMLLAAAPQPTERTLSDENRPVTWAEREAVSQRVDRALDPVYQTPQSRTARGFSAALELAGVSMSKAQWELLGEVALALVQTPGAEKDSYYSFTVEAVQPLLRICDICYALTPDAREAFLRATQMLLRTQQRPWRGVEWDVLRAMGTSWTTAPEEFAAAMDVAQALMHSGGDRFLADALQRLSDMRASGAPGRLRPIAEATARVAQQDRYWTPSEWERLEELAADGEAQMEDALTQLERKASSRTPLLSNLSTIAPRWSIDPDLLSGILEMDVPNLLFETSQLFAQWFARVYADQLEEIRRMANPVDRETVVGLMVATIAEQSGSRAAYLRRPDVARELLRLVGAPMEETFGEEPFHAGGQTVEIAPSAIRPYAYGYKASDVAQKDVPLADVRLERQRQGMRDPVLLQQRGGFRNVMRQWLRRYRLLLDDHLAIGTFLADAGYRELAELAARGWLSEEDLRLALNFHAFDPTHLVEQYQEEKKRYQQHYGHEALETVGAYDRSQAQGLWLRMLPQARFQALRDMAGGLKLAATVALEDRVDLVIDEDMVLAPPGVGKRAHSLQTCRPIVRELLRWKGSIPQSVWETPLLDSKEKTHRGIVSGRSVAGELADALQRYPMTVDGVGELEQYMGSGVQDGTLDFAVLTPESYPDQSESATSQQTISDQLERLAPLLKQDGRIFLMIPVGDEQLPINLEFPGYTAEIDYTETFHPHEGRAETLEELRKTRTVRMVVLRKSERGETLGEQVVMAVTSQKETRQLVQTGASDGRASAGETGVRAGDQDSPPSGGVSEPRLSADRRGGGQVGEGVGPVADVGETAAPMLGAARGSRLSPQMQARVDGWTRRLTVASEVVQAVQFMTQDALRAEIPPIQLAMLQMLEAKMLSPSQYEGLTGEIEKKTGLSPAEQLEEMLIVLYRSGAAEREQEPQPLLTTTAPGVRVDSVAKDRVRFIVAEQEWRGDQGIQQVVQHLEANGYEVLRFPSGVDQRALLDIYNGEGVVIPFGRDPSAFGWLADRPEFRELFQRIDDLLRGTALTGVNFLNAIGALDFESLRQQLQTLASA